MKDAVNIVFK